MEEYGQTLAKMIEAGGARNDDKLNIALEEKQQVIVCDKFK